MILIDVLKKIGAGVKFVALKVRDGFVAVFGSETAQAFGQASLDMLKTEAGKVVTSVVAAVQELPVSGAEKRAEAFARVVEQAKESGLSLKSSWINLLIELAVSYMKGTFRVEEADETEESVATE